MKRSVVLLLLLVCCCSTVFSIEVDSLFEKKFGKVTVYHPVGTPTSVAIFVSGDGGWRHGVLNMAINIARQGALVLGIDAKHYNKYLSKLKAGCLYPAADFEELSLDVQKRYKFATYYKPVLIGYSYGAVLVYGILAQAPSNTFKGAIALGFCPDIDLPKPLCTGNGLTQHVIKAGKRYYLEATNKLAEPFIVLNGVRDETCPFEATASFLKDMPQTELVTLPKVGHGFSIADNWLPQFNAAYQKILRNKAQEPRVADKKLPITMVSPTKKNDLPLMFLISGDGGWTSFDQKLSVALAEKGFSVIGLDAQKYFWKPKTPESSAEEFNKLILQFQQECNKQSFVLAGYSFGASVIPFIANRLSNEVKGDLRAVVMLSPDEKADFEIHILDLLKLGTRDTPYDVIAEAKKISTVKPFCVFGKDEDEDVKLKFSKNGIKVYIVPGGHHFTDDLGIVAGLIKTHVD
jgi:type IV secretory pathway VirJ component